MERSRGVDVGDGDLVSLPDLAERHDIQGRGVVVVSSETDGGVAGAAVVHQGGKGVECDAERVVGRGGEGEGIDREL